MVRRKTAIVSIGVGLAGLLALRHCAAGPGSVSLPPVPAPVTVPGSPPTVARLVRVIDGDSLEVALPSGARVEVRLHGVDAPEHGQAWGEGARDALARRLGPNAELVLEPATVDDYGRLVARVSVAGIQVEPWLLREGHAWVYRRYVTDPRTCEWEDEARSARRGLWAAEPGTWVAPWAFRRHQRTAPAARLVPDRPDAAECRSALSTISIAAREAPATGRDPGCRIKGNVGARGQRIYHVPGTPDYASTRIDPTRGERWFCSEQEAREAGWRPPR